MTGRSGHPEIPASRDTVVPLRAPRPRVRGLWLHMAQLTGDTPALVVITDDDRAYLFRPEILPLAGDLLSKDPASLVQAGAGLDITMFFGAEGSADLSQAVAICRARQQANHGQHVPGRRPGHRSGPKP